MEIMNVSGNFVYDTTGNLIEDKYLQGESSKNALVHFYCRTAAYCALRNSKRLKISYDWRGMPVEFVHDVSDAKDAYKLVMAYDGSGRRISKTRMRKDDQRGYWYTDHVTHYTGIGTEVRESYHRATSPEVEVVVNVPNGLGRYGVEDASDPYKGIDKELAGYIPSAKIEWYLKNHLGSTMLVYSTAAYDDSYFSNFEGGVKAAYDYRAFGEQIDLVSPSSGKVTENFTGKERDDETELSYHEARYLDPMLGVWISVDPKRFFPSPYLYMGNEYNPIRFADLNGMKPHDPFRSRKEVAEDFARTYNDDSIRENAEYSAAIYSYMKDGQKYYSYNVPLKGDSRSAPFDNYVAPGQTFEATVHAHGAYDIDLYDPITGNDGNYLPSVMPGDYYVNFKLHNVRGPAYLSTPGGHLVEYGVDYIGILYMNVVPSSGIAADEFSPYIAPGAVDAYDGSADDPYREK